MPESDDIIKYFWILNHKIPIEKTLINKKIVNLVQADKENQEVNDGNDDDDEIPLIMVKKAVSGLETFINFFEQQNDNKFNNENLHVFRNI